MKCCNEWPSRVVAVGSDTTTKCTYSMESPVKRAYGFFKGRRYALPCFLFSHRQCCKTTCSLEFPKNGLHAYSFSGGLGAVCLKHLWCIASVTNCRKNDLASWFAGIGGYSVLRADLLANKSCWLVLHHLAQQKSTAWTPQSHQTLFLLQTKVRIEIGTGYEANLSQFCWCASVGAL